MTHGPAVVLLTGATGYVGGRLLRALEARGLEVRCLSRRPETLRGRTGPRTEIVFGDVLDTDSLFRAMEGVETAYYLVHSMGTAAEFASIDRVAAENFAHAARGSGVRRIVYLGGLGKGASLSPHLASRQEVGAILRASGVPTVEFRASIILGSGSLSFEMIRALVNRLPVMTTPRWVNQRAQPIAIEDVVEYLVEALNLSIKESAIYEIGGPDQVSYGDLMREYARQKGLRRLIVPVPVLTPRLSGRWLGLVTPVYARVGRKLIDSLRNETVVHDESALEAFSVRPMTVRQAIRRALLNEDLEYAEIRWSDALSAAGRPPSQGVLSYGSRLVDSCVRWVPFPPAKAFEPIQRIGGETGWYYGDTFWKLRGFLDLLVGGVGIRRGRRHPEKIAVGDAIDFWRVGAFEPHSLLRLHAEMKLPGRAWLQFEVTPEENGSLIRQTAIFDPAGLAGLTYWYALYPIHHLVFRGMLRKICKAIDSGRTRGTPRRTGLAGSQETA